MNSDSMRCIPSRCAQLCPVGPSSVIPVWSNDVAEYAASIASRVDGMLAPGSPAWMVTLISEVARSNPSSPARRAIRSA